jgi:hypothetical protein
MTEENAAPCWAPPNLLPKLNPFNKIGQTIAVLSGKAAWANPR